MALRWWEANSLHRLIRLSGATDHEVLFRAAESNAVSCVIVSAAADHISEFGFSVALHGAGSCAGNDFAAFHYRQLACFVVKLQIVHALGYQRAVDLDVRQEIYGFFFAFRKNRKTCQ